MVVKVKNNDSLFNMFHIEKNIYLNKFFYNKWMVYERKSVNHC